MSCALCATLNHVDTNKLITLIDGLTGELCLILGGSNLRAKAGGLTSVVENYTFNSIKVVLECDVAPDVIPKTFAGYGEYSLLSKFVLSMGMLLGRLEIWPILLTFYPATWLSRKAG